MKKEEMVELIIRLLDAATEEEVRTIYFFALHYTG